MDRAVRYGCRRLQEKSAWMHGRTGLRWYGISVNGQQVSAGDALAPARKNVNDDGRNRGFRDRGKMKNGRKKGDKLPQQDDVFLGRGHQMGGLSPLRTMGTPKLSKRVTEILNRPEEKARREQEAREKAKRAEGPIISFEQGLESTRYGIIKRALLISAERCQLKTSEVVNERIGWYCDLTKKFGYTMQNDMLLRVALVDEVGARSSAMSHNATESNLDKLQFGLACSGVLRERNPGDVVTNAQLAWIGDAIFSVLQRSSLLHGLITERKDGSSRFGLRKLADTLSDPPFADAHLALLALREWRVPRGHVRYARSKSKLEVHADQCGNENAKLLPADVRAYGSLVEAVVGAVLLDSMQYGLAVEFARRAVAGQIQSPHFFKRLE